MKTIAQLLQLSQNKFYKFTDEEQEALDAFLAQQAEQSSNSYENTPAIVHNKNRFDKETGDLPVINSL